MTDPHPLRQAGFIDTDALQLLRLCIAEPEIKPPGHDSVGAFEHMKRSHSKGSDELVAAEFGFSLLGLFHVVEVGVDRVVSVSPAVGWKMDAGHSASTPRILVGVGQVNPSHCSLQGAPYWRSIGMSPEAGSVI